jgi:hypothetical protein
VSYSKVLETRGDYRVKLEVEEGPPEPYDDGQSPLLRLDYRGHPEHVDVGTRPHDCDERIEEAAATWGADRDGDLLEKYLRAYHGVTQVVYYRNSSYTYITYDDARWREAVGAEPGSASLEEYKAWAEGEVFGWVVEKRVRWNRAEPEDGPDDTMDTWEPEDSCGGFYGLDYAEKCALEALDGFAPKEPAR